jgi:hypothetical protein
LVTLRILRDKDESGRYELRHDALASKIYEKITLVEKELMEVRQFIENAYANYQKRKVLLSKEDLEYMAPYEGRLILPEDLTSFIALSKKQLEKSKRRRQTLVGIFALVLLLVFAGFTIWALTERNKAVKALNSEEKAKKDKIVAQQTLTEVIKSKGGIVTSIDKMNIIYVGIENPISYAVSGIPDSLIYIDVDPFSAISRIEANKLFLSPKNEGLVKIKYYLNREKEVTIISEKILKAIKMPAPVAKIGGKIGGKITKEYILMQGGIEAIQENFMFDLKFKVNKFEIIASDGINSVQIPSFSSKFTLSQIEAINSLKPGAFIMISNIEILGADGVIRNINGMIFNIVL